MAYAAAGSGAATISRSVNGRSIQTWVITETELAATSEYTLTGVPRQGYISFYQSELTGGSGSTIRPSFRNATGAWAADGSGSVSNIVRPSAAAGVQGTTDSKFYLTAGTMYIRTTVDGSADNTATTYITIVDGVP